MKDEKLFTSTKALLIPTMTLIIASLLLVNSGQAAASVTGAMLQASFVTNPVGSSPGSDGYVQLVLTNVGGTTASNVKVTQLLADPYISVSSGAISSLGSLGSGSQITQLMKFSVAPIAPSGLYLIKFTVNYCNDNGCNDLTPTAIISVQSTSSLSVASITPSTLASGQTDLMWFKIVNNGVDKVSNIVMTWSTPSNEILPLGLSNRQFIPSLDGGATTTVPINVTVGASVSPGIYPMTVRLQFFDKAGVSQNVSSVIGVQIGGTTAFDVGVQDTTSGTTTLSLANIGVNPATSVAVSIPSQQYFAVSGADSIFIGNLNPGDYSVASFTVVSKGTGFGQADGQQQPSANMTQPVRNLVVDVSYSDTSGTRQVVEKQVPLSLVQSTIAARTGFQTRGTVFGLSTIEVLGIGAIVVAIILVWYFRIRKPKKKASA